MPLTKRQREILTYLSAYSEQNGFAPSFEEIAEQFRYNSLATVHEHLTNLERKGYIKRSYNESRAIEILPSEATPRAIELPILGAVAAGERDPPAPGFGDEDSERAGGRGPDCGLHFGPSSAIVELQFGESSGESPYPFRI